MEDSETGYAGSLPDQLGILHIPYLLSLTFVEDSETGYAGSLPDQIGILHILSFYFSYLYLLSPAFMEDSETGYTGSLPDQLGSLISYPSTFPIRIYSLLLSWRTPKLVMCVHFLTS